MITEKTHILRIKRQKIYLSRDEICKHDDTLQQWNANIKNRTKGYWSDIPIVETDDDDELGEI